MKVLFAVGSYWPSQDGVAHITKYLAEGLAMRGHQVRILTSAGKGGLQELPHEEIYNQVHIKRMRVYVQWPSQIKGRDTESTQKKYYQYVKDFHPDILIVVCSQTWTLDWIIPYLDEIKCPKIFYSHGYSKWKEHYAIKENLFRGNLAAAIIEFKAKAYYKKLYKYIEKFDSAIYLSKENNSYRYAQQHGLNNSNILENAVEEAFFSTDISLRDKVSEEQGISFLFIANYNENKNQEMLIQAYIRANIGKSRLVLAGFEENPYYEYLQQLISEEDMKKYGKEVECHTHLERNEIIELYRNANVFVCPSKQEAWPVVALEAAAVSLPIISTDVGFYRDIPGTIIVQNIDEMSSAIETLYHDSQDRIHRGAKAHEWIETKHSHVKDKVDWLEKEAYALIKKRGKE